MTTPKEREALIWIFERALEKLKLYRAQHSGEYIGGMEFGALQMKMEDTIRGLKEAAK